MTDWQQLVRELRRSGLSDERTAERVGVSRHYVWQLCNGRVKEPRHSLGERLLALRDESG